MITLSEHKTQPEHREQPLRGRVFLVLILFALTGAFLSAATALALGHSLGLVLLAYAFGGSGFYLAGALTVFLAFSKD
ncbi:hypothetical protein [Roseinatronobacter sp. S2]|uniref:hypothetical protein n=1 Tax=Roseinatronobacter sp. S2 TaxID=3035471 RepID=UPI00240F5DEA|nr:hypothetical protein [Roseinatronobacter sp. S2]WFE76879.1 hypothetical protein P8S53_17700 [Roseinatronobacter sp. S2]